MNFWVCSFFFYSNFNICLTRLIFEGFAQFLQTCSLSGVNNLEITHHPLN